MSRAREGGAPGLPGPVRAVLCVCLGNICRSPIAEGVLRHRAREAGLALEVDSAGTGAWHAGEPPDRRATAAARRQGVILEGRARQVAVDDFARFDLVLAMDRSNHRDLLARCPRPHVGKVRRLGEWDPRGGAPDVPDPYYGGDEGFDEVFALVDRCARALIAALQATDRP